MRFPKLAGVTVALLSLTAFLASANTAVEKQRPPQAKNATGCTSQPDSYYFNGNCVPGSGGCYYCEHTDPYGTYGCYEAPNPADGVNCFALDYQTL